MTDGSLIFAWENNRGKEKQSLVPKCPVFPLSVFNFFPLHLLITPINLLPSTEMRHQIRRHRELQISSELALEEMGGDGRRRQR